MLVGTIIYRRGVQNRRDHLSLFFSPATISSIVSPLSPANTHRQVLSKDPIKSLRFSSLEGIKVNVLLDGSDFRF
jgi:hypothetical protein